MEKSMLLEAYLKRLRLPAIGRHYQELARQAAQGNLPYEAFLLALVELEAQQREENAHQKRLRMAKFPVHQEPGPVRLHGGSLPQQSPDPGPGSRGVT